MSLNYSCFKQLVRPFSLLQNSVNNYKIFHARPNLEKTQNFLIPMRFKSLKCWQCGIERKNISELFCSECNFIQNPQQNENYFKLFELEENFEVNLKELTQKYRKMQSQLHPDKFSNKTGQEKEISEDFSSLVNKAYKILQMPLQRAIHLLNIKGKAIEEDQRVDDPSFLMEIMELNEQVEDANTEEKLVELNKKNKQDLEKITKNIIQAFSSNKLEQAQDCIIKMKYYTSISKHINSLMRERGIVE